MKHRDAIRRCKPGPAQDAAKRRALNVSAERAFESQLLHLSAIQAFKCTFLSQVLKQKRLYESQRDQIYNQQFNVEQTSFVMENVQDSVQTVQAMKAAGVAIL